MIELLKAVIEIIDKSEQVQLAIQVGGLPFLVLMVTMSFWWRYAKQQNKLVGSLIAQQGRTEDILINSLSNNTAALTELTTTMKLGCPAIQRGNNESTRK